MYYSCASEDSVKEELRYIEFHLFSGMPKRKYQRYREKKYVRSNSALGRESSSDVDDSDESSLKNEQCNMEDSVTASCVSNLSPTVFDNEHRWTFSDEL